MRVISGKCKGRNLFGPKGSSIRPTSDRTKEVIFNFIYDAVKNVNVLDLFAGTGSLAIEALSRGASSATLIDNSAEAVRLIYKNVKLTNFLSKCKIIRKDVFRFLKIDHQSQIKYGLIFADPPYSNKMYQKLIEAIDNGNILAEGGLFVLEHSFREKPKNDNASLLIRTQKTLGDSAITIFQKKGGRVEDSDLSGNI